MALNITGTIGSVFQVEDKGTFVKANISTSRKMKDNLPDGNADYRNSNWRATFVGKCAESAKKLTDKDRIYINNARLTCEAARNKNNEFVVNEIGKKIFYTDLTIFDFEMFDPDKHLRKKGDVSSNTESKDVNMDSEDLPF